MQTEVVSQKEQLNVPNVYIYISSDLTVEILSGPSFQSLLVPFLN